MYCLLFMYKKKDNNRVIRARYRKEKKLFKWHFSALNKMQRKPAKSIKKKSS